ncbi:hypothetical protein [Bowmanella yangjiangensis]|uniref:Uncharacterized protein n=1 Tax=Bowmanella yangjiangensis TaxID=2811230 RepID=A0ABS3CVQ1_9ALTE|nr:hypothetical protein [Bowmanella yangjiangensis]MBN7821196.1 hypothetical protein [Bowmanella yangjiangensis]
MLKDLFIKYNTKYQYWDFDEIRQWQDIQEKGLLRFILLEGLIKWGLLSFAIFMTILITTQDISPADIPLIALIWAIVACLYGYSIWLGTQLSYNRHRNSNK